MRKLIVAAVALLFLGTLGWKIYAKVTAPEAEAQSRGRGVVAVEAAPVTKASIRDMGYFTGTLDPRSQFVVAPKVGGRLEKLLVNIGDTIESGQLIAVIDAQEYAQQVDQADAELQVALANLEESRSNLEVARRELERIEALREKMIASESELDSQRAGFRAQEARFKVNTAQVSQREAALRGAEVRLSYTRIHAAWDGGGRRSIGERFVDEGAMLSANAQIATVIDIGVLTAVLNIIERDYARVNVGQLVKLTTDAFPRREFGGRVARIAPILREESRQARVEIEVENPEGILKPGMFVRAEVEFALHEEVTVVPVSALARRGEARGVFVPVKAGEGTTARFVPVTVGITSGAMAEVIEPVDFGDTVITLGHHLLEDGSTIRLPDAVVPVQASQAPPRQADAPARAN